MIWPGNSEKRPVPAVILTIDLEDPTGVYAPSGRYVQMTERLLSMFDETQRRATFFVTGQAAAAAPEMIRKIAALRHEIAWHTRNHVPLTLETPQRFRQESRVDKDMLEQLCGQEVAGFRAPCFSLTPKTMWAVDVLGETGFRYSSSIMPTCFSLFGFPRAPSMPFLWPNGLAEFPLPVAGAGFLRIPYLGGVYLYSMPFFLVTRWLKKAASNECLWTYAHPFDFDAGAPFERFPGVPLWIGLAMWMLRSKAESKIRRLCAFGGAGTLKDFLDSGKIVKRFDCN